MKTLYLILALITSSLVRGQVQVVTLNGTGSSDPDGTIVTWKWAQVGTTPSICVITNSDKAIATVVPAGGAQWSAGVYKFSLTVTDNQGATASDTMNVSWAVNPDKFPIVSAGNDVSIQAPANSVVLTAVASDPDGTIASYLWSQVSGPSVATFNSTTLASVTASNLIVGVYAFRVLVKDNLGAGTADTVQVTVKAANQLPKANAGPDQQITLPISSVTIGAMDPAGSVVAWRKVSGPSSYFIVSPSSSITKVTNLKKGVYVFEKQVTANGFTVSDQVTVTVKKNAFGFGNYLAFVKHT